MKRTMHRYMIEFSGCETLESLPIRLSEGDFKKHKCKYEKIVAETVNEDEFKVEYRRYDYDREDSTKTLHFFTIGTSEIILTEIHCKQGYCFR